MMSVAETHPLPSGTVTFLFTDIEGSTRLFQRLGEQWSDVLAEHNRLIRGAVERHGGVAINAEGDGLFLVFGSAHEGVVAAVEAQRGIESHRWPPGSRVRVRMGLHSGTATPVHGEYVALAVHEAARIASAGHGGQILMSAAAADAAGALPPEISTMTLGAQRLRDFPEPVVLFQVGHSDLGTSFPPLRSVGVLAHNLPVARSSFVGRHDERRGIIELLRDPSLLTIVGPAGVGKTRLALEVATDLLASYPDGVWLVELASISDGGLLAATVLGAVGVPVEGNEDPEAVLTRSLRPKRAMLVLDNCEHLIDDIAALAERLTRTCPLLGVLATSRESLDIDGETVWRLIPLATPPAGMEDPTTLLNSDSVRLFVDRAARRVPNFDLSSEGAMVVASIVRRLDGIPLAIELAAARVVDLGPSAILARLDDRFRLLTRGRRTALPHQRTLETTINWSHELLADVERRLFRRLAVFAGGFRSDAAEAVCADRPAGAKVTGLLERLEACSMLQAVSEAGGPRYSMLESVRAFAFDRLDEAGEREEYLGRHVEWCCELVESLGPDLGGQGAPLLAGLDVLESEHDNLRAALSFAADGAGEDLASFAARSASALVPFWQARGHLQEGVRWFRRLLPVIANLDARSLADAEWAAAEMALSAEDLEFAGQLFEDLAQRANELSDPVLQARVAVGTAKVDRLEGRVAETVAAFAEAASVFHAHAELADEMRCRHELAKAHFTLGSFEEAAAAGQAALDLSGHAGSLERSRLLNTLAATRFRLGRGAEAVVLLEQCVDLKRELGDRYGLGVAYINLASIEAADHHLEAADEHYLRAAELGHAIQHARLLTTALQGLGEVAAAAGRANRGARLLGAAEGLRTSARLGLSAPNEADIKSTLAMLRAAMPPAAVDEELVAGRAMSAEQALAYALHTEQGSEFR